MWISYPTQKEKWIHNRNSIQTLSIILCKITYRKYLQHSATRSIIFNIKGGEIFERILQHKRIWRAFRNKQNNNLQTYEEWTA